LGARSANLGQTAHYSHAIAHFVDRRSRTCTPTTTHADAMAALGAMAAGPLHADNVISLRG
jgi:hypothetical protein